MFDNLLKELKEIKKDPWRWGLRVILDHSAWYISLGLLWSFHTWVLQYFQALSLTNTEKIAVGIVVTFSIILIIVFYTMIKKIIYIYAENKRLTKLIEVFGIKGFYPYVTGDQREQEWGLLVEEFKKSHPQHLNILTLNGWDTFASEKAPLHEYLKTYQGDLSIFIIDPKSKACRIRKQSLEVDKQQFILNHQKTIDFCKSLKLKGVNINLRLYSQLPIWKMIGTESYIWLQHYEKFSKKEANAVYVFYKDTGKTSMYFPLNAVFDKVINFDDNQEINLESCEPSK